MAPSRKWMLAAVLASAFAVPAMAAPAAKTRLVTCGSESCLLISGKRADPSSPVSINGHAVETRGARNWRASVPVSTVRVWSVLHARTVSVTVAGASHEAELPVGMLGPKRDLAMLEVRVK